MVTEFNIENVTMEKKQPKSYNRNEISGNAAIAYAETLVGNIVDYHALKREKQRLNFENDNVVDLEAVRRAKKISNSEDVGGCTDQCTTQKERNRVESTVNSDVLTPTYYPSKGKKRQQAKTRENNIAAHLESEPSDRHRRLPSTELAMGHIVDGRYEIISEIARGGYGVVYRARQIGIDRIVALKRLKARNEPSLIQRFLLESNIIKNLIHPNTVQLIDAGKDENDRLFIVMEYVEGRSLQKLLDQSHGLSLQRAISITIQILKSLNEAHARGIIHRDLKPGNIILRDVIGEQDFVKVLDFGIAKQYSSLEPKLTQDGKILGTPQYIAPELIIGQAPTAASDIYSIGLMLLYMMTGKLTIPSNPMDAMKWHVSANDVEIPAWLRNMPIGSVICKAVRKNPFERYQTAMEMIFDLRRIESMLYANSVDALKKNAVGKKFNILASVSIGVMSIVVICLFILVMI